VDPMLLLFIKNCLLLTVLMPVNAYIAIRPRESNLNVVSQLVFFELFVHLHLLQTRDSHQQPGGYTATLSPTLDARDARQNV